MLVTFRTRRDTLANWTSVNPVLTLAEQGYVTDTGRLKFGDGVTAWNSLPYFAPHLIGTDVQAYDADLAAIAALTPADDDVLQRKGGVWVNRTPSQLLTDLGGFKGALVRKAADETAANYTTATTVAWDQEVYDTSSIHDNVTNNTRLTVPTGASYVRLTANLCIASITSGVFVYVHIKKNGAFGYDGCGSTIDAAPNTTKHTQVVTPVLAVTAGDYFEVSLTVQTDTSVNITATQSSFSMEIVY